MVLKGLKKRDDTEGVKGTRRSGREERNVMLGGGCKGREGDEGGKEGDEMGYSNEMM